MADLNQNTPTVQGTLSSLNKLKNTAVGSTYGDYLNSIYSAGLNLQDSESSLVKESTIQLDELKDQSTKLLKTNKGASRADMMEMTDAINNSIGQFANNTIRNRETLQENTQSWLRGVGDLIQDESVAKVMGEEYWNSLAGTNKEKYDQFNDTLTKLNADDGFLDIYFDENERAEAGANGGYLTDDWMDAFKPSAYDKQKRLSERGLVGRFFVGGDYTKNHFFKNAVTGFGNALNFMLWQPLEFMTIDMVTNSIGFISSIFDGEGDGPDWGKAIGAGLAIGNWMLILGTAGGAAAIEEAVIVGEEELLTKGEQVLVGAGQSKEEQIISETLTKTGEFSSFAEDSIFSMEAKALLEEGFITDLTAETEANITKALREYGLGKEASKEAGVLFSKDFRPLSEFPNRFEQYGIDEGAKKVIEKELMKHRGAISKEITSKIESGAIKSMKDFEKYINLESLVSNKVISNSERYLLEDALTTIENDIAKATGKKIEQKVVTGATEGAFETEVEVAVDTSIETDIEKTIASETDNISTQAEDTLNHMNEIEKEADIIEETINEVTGNKAKGWLSRRWDQTKSIGGGIGGFGKKWGRRAWKVASPVSAKAWSVKASMLTSDVIGAGFESAKAGDNEFYDWGAYFASLFTGGEGFFQGLGNQDQFLVEQPTLEDTVAGTTAQEAQSITIKRTLQSLNTRL